MSKYRFRTICLLFLLNITLVLSKPRYSNSAPSNNRRFDSSNGDDNDGGYDPRYDPNYDPKQTSSRGVNSRGEYDEYAYDYTLRHKKIFISLLLLDSIALVNSKYSKQLLTCIPIWQLVLMEVCTSKSIGLLHKYCLSVFEVGR